MCVCVCACMHLCAFVCICMHLCVIVCICVHLCAFVFVFVCVCMCVCVCVCVYNKYVYNITLIFPYIPLHHTRPPIPLCCDKTHGTTGGGLSVIDLLIKIACFGKTKKSIFVYKPTNLNKLEYKEVNRTDPSPTVRIPWPTYSEQGRL